MFAAKSPKAEQELPEGIPEPRNVNWRVAASGGNRRTPAGRISPKVIFLGAYSLGATMTPGTAAPIRELGSNSTCGINPRYAHARQRGAVTRRGAGLRFRAHGAGADLKPAPLTRRGVSYALASVADV